MDKNIYGTYQCTTDKSKQINVELRPTYDGELIHILENEIAMPIIDFTKVSEWGTCSNSLHVKFFNGGMHVARGASLQADETYKKID